MVQRRDGTIESEEYYYMGEKVDKEYIEKYKKINALLKSQQNKESSYRGKNTKGSDKT